jgi:[ribosomal protein S5]-alanine N-acetyltransferase
MAQWPVELRGRTPAGEEIVLDALRRRDKADWMRVRAMNREWLAPWEATSPNRERHVVTFAELVRHYNKEGRGGRMLPFVIRTASNGRVVGQMSLFGISLGSLMSVSAGYWVDEAVAGRGITPTALALAGDYALGVLGLHRIEVNIRPENANSIAVVHKLGFRDEGLRPAYLHIDGAWRDHRSFALTVEDLGGRTLVERMHNNHTSHIGDTPPHVPGVAPEDT